MWCVCVGGGGEVLVNETDGSDGPSIVLKQTIRNALGNEIVIIRHYVINSKQEA